jgi:hypothetical protein
MIRASCYAAAIAAATRQNPCTYQLSCARARPRLLALHWPDLHLHKLHARQPQVHVQQHVQVRGKDALQPDRPESPCVGTRLAANGWSAHSPSVHPYLLIRLQLLAQRAHSACTCPHGHGMFRGQFMHTRTLLLHPHACRSPCNGRCLTLQPILESSSSMAPASAAPARTSVPFPSSSTSTRLAPPTSLSTCLKHQVAAAAVRAVQQQAGAITDKDEAQKKTRGPRLVAHPTPGAAAVAARAAPAGQPQSQEEGSSGGEAAHSKQ